jgi:hypothetical protein
MRHDLVVGVRAGGHRRHPHGTDHSHAVRRRDCVDQVFSRQPFGPASVVRHHDSRELVVIETEENLLYRVSFVRQCPQAWRQPHELLNELRTLMDDARLR